MFISILDANGECVGTKFVPGATEANRYGRYMMRQASKAYGDWCIDNGKDNASHYWEWSG